MARGVGGWRWAAAGACRLVSSPAPTPTPTPRPLTAPDPITRFDEQEFSKTVGFYKKTAAPAALERLVAKYAEAGKLTSQLALVALHGLQALNATALTEPVYRHWRADSRAGELRDDPETGTSLIKMLCRLQHPHLAEAVARSYRADLASLEPTDTDSNTGAATAASRLHAAVRYSAMTHLALGHAMGGNAGRATAYMHALAARGASVDDETAGKILRGVIRHGSLQEVVQSARHLVDCGGLSDHAGLHLLTHAFVKDITFVKGAVSMATLPEKQLPEVMFVGRSNVGKSSLLNALTNKKGLAHTSKTAGKTTEFNYFEALGTVGAQRQESRFFLVDVPGVGFAVTSKKVKSVWIDFQREYVRTRPMLRCVFHLVDSRHGLLDADQDCLALLEDLPAHVQYVVVFTKIDKLKKDKFRVQPEILRKVTEEVRRRTQRRVPIIYSSADSKLGAADLLCKLLECVHGEVVHSDGPATAAE